MKLLMINSCCGIGSTGRICTDLAKGLLNKGDTVRIAYSRGNVPEKYQDISIKIGSEIDVYIQALKCRMFDCDGFGNEIPTRRFINWMDKFRPDLVHLHNLHGYYINIAILFEYLKKTNVPVIWTLHDCWSFTGHCTYFDYINCSKWMSHCDKCPQKRNYPSSILRDNSAHNYSMKKNILSELNNLTIVTPSKWLSSLVKQSYLKDHPIKVIRNGVDTSVFYHRDSNILARYKLDKYKVILGVASPWSERKGFKDFIKLSKIISDDYRILLVGLDRKQIDKLPSNIIGLERTNNIDELAELYSASFVFVNPTYEDNYPTTNIEAVACGTPVITYDTGGSVESADPFCVVRKGDINSLYRTILNEPKIIDSLPVGKEDMIKSYKELYCQLSGENL